MKNLKIAQTTVELLEGLPNVATQWKKYNFDVSAFNWGAINNSPYMKPVLVDEVHDENGGFAACFPSKRVFQIDNFMTGSDKEKAATSSSQPYISWTPVLVDGLDGAFKDTVTNKDLKPPFDSYSGAVPINPPPGSTDNWKGPIWSNNNVNKIPFPNDMAALNAFYKKYNIKFNVTSSCLVNEVANETAKNEKIPSVWNIYQRVVRDGLWWAVRSANFLSENMPFWVYINKPKSPTSFNHTSYIVIRFGKNDPNNQFDIWIGSNMKPRLIDYSLAGQNDGSSNSVDSSANADAFTGTNNNGKQASSAGMQTEFTSDQTMVYDGQEEIMIGVMTIAGRLVVYVNGNPFVYSRTNKDKNSDGGTLNPCKIVAGGIDICGTNIQASINVSPMVFAPQSLMVLPIPQAVSITTENDGMPEKWKGVGYNNTMTDSVAILPKPPSEKDPVYGCDCTVFIDENGPIAPKGVGFHKDGAITFAKGDSSTFASIPNTDFYYVIMMSTDKEMTIAGNEQNKTFPLCYGGVPFFFRLQGVKQNTPNAKYSATDISNYVISVDETLAAPDYFHVKRSATVTLYNPNGVISSMGGQLGLYQKGIRISFAWSETDMATTFTGIITSVSSSQTAGKETLVINCEDYMYMLKNVPIVNSPFYDGMVAFYAVKEIVSRVGVLQLINDGFNDDYFLPSGLSFTKPAMRFPSSQNLFDCIMSIVKRFEAFVYFDENGFFHIKKLPGGLFSVVTESPKVRFVSNPFDTNVDPSCVILGERTVDFNYDSTVNNISILTVDRKTRNPIICAMSAQDNHLAYRRTWLKDEPALGELQAAKAWVREISKRVFFPILKTRFKTIGGNSNVNTPIMALDFVTVDEQPFRLMSIKRTFNADQNDLSTSYEAEWLGGQ